MTPPVAPGGLSPYTFYHALRHEIVTEPLHETIPNGLVVFQLPRVKSGKTWGIPSSDADFSLNGPTDDQKHPS